ncbi:IS4 family transposase ISDge11 [Deinococcus xinjiangensis]|uniref:IS4 family transposase ISDge11 n=1 Tax=Deinococcus xinjiangensis TaxID=457454 RepID=A0ABP9VGQ1_9DEIO
MCCSTSPASFEPHAIHNQGLVTFGKPEPDHRRSLVVTQFGELKNIGQDVLDILLLLFPEGKLTSVMDRTSWKYGQTHLNVLVLAVWVGDLALQLAWKVLPHGGNSDMRTRMFLVGTLLRHLPARRWAVLIADREFIGQEWFSFLRDRGIKRCIRIRENTLIDEEKAKVEFQNLQVGQVRGLLERAWVYGSWMQVVATLSPQGERVLVASDRPIWETLTTYRRRWTVECTSSAMKTRGLNLEQTHMTAPDRLGRLFGLLCLALAWLLRIGVEKARAEPIRVMRKKNRPTMSRARYGAQELGRAIRWAEDTLYTFISLLSTPFPALGQRKSKDVRC